MIVDLDIIMWCKINDPLIYLIVIFLYMNY